MSEDDGRVRADQAEVPHGQIERDDDRDSGHHAHDEQKDVTDGELDTPKRANVYAAGMASRRLVIVTVKAMTVLWRRLDPTSLAAPGRASRTRRAGSMKLRKFSNVTDFGSSSAERP